MENISHRQVRERKKLSSEIKVKRSIFWGLLVRDPGKSKFKIEEQGKKNFEKGISFWGGN